MTRREFTPAEIAKTDQAIMATKAMQEQLYEIYEMHLLKYGCDEAKATLETVQHMSAVFIACIEVISEDQLTNMVTNLIALALQGVKSNVR